MSLSVLTEYGFNKDLLQVEDFGNGLINHTWKVIYLEKEYILQRVNDAVFKRPFDIASNISLMAQHFHYFQPQYKFVAPIISLKGEELICRQGEGYFRLFPFVSRSHSIDVVETPDQACEAAAQFGKFTRLLNGIDIGKLKITIPSFHDLSLRYQQFLTALEHSTPQRLDESGDLVKNLLACSDIVTEYAHLKHNPEFRQRVTHHDTKISNVLFSEQGKGLCVIDLDTVMPGHFISDVGDMMRTYLSPVGEEEKDFSQIEVRDEIYRAIVKGYLTEMKDELTGTEKEHFFYAGKFMIFMQSIRFLTDFLNGDIYYSTSYPKHNLLRAQNQFTLLRRYMEAESKFSKIVSDFTDEQIPDIKTYK